jgi:hypothetical protein
MRIVIESGVLYTGTSLITFVSYITNSIAVYVTTDVVSLKNTRLTYALTSPTGGSNNRHRVQPHHNPRSADLPGELLHDVGNSQEPWAVSVALGGHGNSKYCCPEYPSAHQCDGHRRNRFG